MHPILGTIVQRLFLGLVTLFFVSLIIFSSVEFLPGDFTQAILGQAATEETVAAFRAELGLDKPAYIRYFDWIGAVAQGDLGYSFSGRSASGGGARQRTRTTPVRIAGLHAVHAGTGPCGGTGQHG